MIYEKPKNHYNKRLDVHTSHRQLHVEPISEPLHVVTVISNPVRYASRYKNFHAFAKFVEDAGAILYVVELALRDRHYEITKHDNPRHIQLRSKSELWHKENLINIGVSHFSPDWHYGAYMDADILCTRPDWVYETLHQLQHYDMVQMFSSYTDLSAKYYPIKTRNSYMYNFKGGIYFDKSQFVTDTDDYGYTEVCGTKQTKGISIGATGLAWAFRRSAFDAIGGFLDTCILGSNDYHTALSLTGKSNYSSESKRCTSGYIKSLKRWETRARNAKLHVGYVENHIIHYWHGPKSLRKYGTRWYILQKHNYDPDIDIKRDWQGVLQWQGNKPEFEDDVRNYFREREEDALS